MSFRINTNTQSAFALSSLNKTSNEIGMRQMRLSTGSRINSAADDSAGFTIANKLQATSRGQAQALSNIGDAKSMLTVAEGALGSTMDILQTIKEKAVQAGNSSMGTEERAAIQTQVDALSKEVNDILGGTDFNGTKLFDDAAATSLSFQVGDKSGDTFGASIDKMGVSTLGLGSVAAADVAASTAVSGANAGNVTSAAYGGSSTEDISQGYRIVANGANYDLEKSDADGNFSVLAASISDGQSITDGDFSFDITTAATTGAFSVDYSAAVSEGDFTSSIDLTTDAGVASALTAIDAAIGSVNKTASKLGDVQNRLDFKSQNLETSMNNYDAARSRISDADFAKEQMEIVKLQILQQTGSAMFAQSNAAPQSVLSFF